MISEIDIKDMLDEREGRYGSFENHAAIAQQLKYPMHITAKWNKLANDQKEALEMVQHKIARILNGDPNYLDNWVDLAGYATLVIKRLEKNV